jgi:CBS domain-containing protein
LLLSDVEVAMSTTHEGTVRCTVYRGHGVAAEQTVERAADDCEIPYHAPVPDRTPLASIMRRDLICARADLDVVTITSLMIERHVGCIPVVDDHGKPIGVITKYDLVEQLAAAMRGSISGCPLPSELRAETADDVMMPLALTLDEHATIAHAAAMMTKEDTHHVLVVDAKGILVGVVSSKDIVAWVAKHDGLRMRNASSGPPEWHPF